MQSVSVLSVVVVVFEHMMYTYILQQNKPMYTAFYISFYPMKNSMKLFWCFGSYLSILVVVFGFHQWLSASPQGVSPFVWGYALIPTRSLSALPLCMASSPTLPMEFCFHCTIEQSFYFMVNLSILKHLHKSTLILSLWHWLCMPWRRHISKMVWILSATLDTWLKTPMDLWLTHCLKPSCPLCNSLR